MDTVILNKVLAIMTTILSMMSSLISQQPQPQPTVSSEPFPPKTTFVQKATKPGVLGAVNISSGGTYRLQSSISGSATSITLSSFKEPISNIKYTMSYLNSTIMYGTLDPANPTNKELISFTGITQNADGSAILTGVSRGLGFSYPFTASSTLQKTHSGQSIFILSDAPGVFNSYANKSNAESITGIWTFSSTSQPVYDGTPTFSNNLALVNYGTLLSTAIQGAGTSTFSTMGISRLAQKTEQAASTASSTTGEPLILTSKFATSTYNTNVGGNYVLITKTDNTIDPGFIGSQLTTFSNGLISQASTTFTGNPVTFAQATTSWTNTLAQLNIGTSTPSLLKGINNAFNEYIAGGLGIGSPTTSPGNLLVTGWASTTNMRVSNICANCVSGYERITGAAHNCTGGVNDCSSVATCSAGKKVIGGGMAGYVPPASGTHYLSASYPDSSTTFTASMHCGTNCGSAAIVGYAICANE